MHFIHLDLENGDFSNSVLSSAFISWKNFSHQLLGNSEIFFSTIEAGKMLDSIPLLNQFPE